MTSIRKISKPRHKSDWLNRIAKAQVIKTLAHLSLGSLTILDYTVEGNAEPTLTFGEADNRYPSANIHVNNADFWSETAFGGTVGAAESYAYGHWKSDDLTALVRLMVINRDTLNQLEGGWAFLSAPARGVFHWLHKNSRRGSRENIQAHYDLGNALFERMLDPTMAYSAAIFKDASTDLHSAQLAKFAQLAEMLALTPGMCIAEIGSGWGGLALYIAKHHQCSVTSITLSKEQLHYATERAKQEGLDHLVRFEYCDYRDLSGKFDRVVSIEMIEAVGAEYLSTYAGAINGLLKPDGRAVLQIIAIQDQLYTEVLQSVDFIQKHIFPGSFIPSLTAVQMAFTEHSDCRIYEVKDIGMHYAKTLNIWRKNVTEHRSWLLTQGYSESFLRLWDYYLSYCEGGFLERQLSDLQITLTKPWHRPKQIVG